MRKGRVESMVNGWFVGDFEPTLLRTTLVEAAVKKYAAGQSEGAHYHKVATELTVVALGCIEMNGERFSEGDVVVIEAGEVTDFRAITDAVTFVLKIPGAKNDKYPV